MRHLRRLRRAAWLAVVAIVLAAPLALGLPAPDPVEERLALAGPGAWVAGYATPVVAIRLGDPLTLVNADLMRHDLVAFEVYGPDTNPWCDVHDQGLCPLFWSPLIGLGEATPVLGLDQLEPGTLYPYYCTLHRSAMQGTLVVLP